MSTTLMFRPKLVWRMLAPGMTLASIALLIAGPDPVDNVFYYVLGAGIMLVWSGYLWTAHLRIDDSRFATLRYFGRSKPTVDLKSLREKHVYLTPAFPYISAIFIVRDSSGHGLRLTRAYWNGWNVIRDLIG